MILRKNNTAHLYPELASAAKSIGDGIFASQTKHFILLKQPLHLNASGAIRNYDEAHKQLLLLQKQFISSALNNIINKNNKK